MKRIVYIVLGLICVSLGTLGVVVPGFAHHAFPAVSLVAFLPILTSVARMAFAVVVRNLHPQLSPSRRDDHCAKSRRLWHHGGDGAVGVLTVIFAVPNAKEE